MSVTDRSDNILYVDILQWLQKNLVMITNCPLSKINPDARLILDLHIDSLEILELVIEVEKKTAKPLADDVWLQWNTINDIVEYIMLTKVTE
ncbi:acyl carrier protein [Yersinia nurmii]|uniref:Acyl carrier protein n=1 Tax=Yersinia nurmii TaxID=685706 RepID=A0AAW7K0N1_9GAMM|nr:acyl carrier protein [Yersinia nurmii]MDN0088897.1 acyl carrier protein [Yersinia nurmii]